MAKAKRKGSSTTARGKRVRAAKRARSLKTVPRAAQSPRVAAKVWLPSEFTSAYIEAALWSSNDESDEPLDKNYSESDIAQETLNEMYADAADFQDRFRDLIESDNSAAISRYGRWVKAGHDFWLTRNRHGAGFWDGDWPENGDALTEASKEYGEYDLYVGDDGQIHGHGSRPRKAKEAPGYQRPSRGAPQHVETSLYDKLKAAGQKLDHHESDLYVRWTPEAEAIIRAHGGPEAANARPFKGSDGRKWIDIPFAYAPFWDRKQRHAREPRRVADFNTLNDLVAHAGRELGATHVSGSDAHTKLYFPRRGGQYPYEEATVWRKADYWHAQGPHARAGIARLPQDARPIGGAARRAAEARPSSRDKQYIGRRVEILKIEDERPSSYFKRGQFGYVVAQNTSGGMHFIDVRRTSAPGEVALLVAKSREMRGGALWFSLDGVRFTNSRDGKPHAGEAARGEPADEHAATELVLYIENTSELSPDGPRGQGHSVLLNALRKWRKGTYSPELAVKLFGYLVESGAKQYAKEFSSGSDWHEMFNKATRLEAARQLEASFRNSAEQGEYDNVDIRTGVRERAPTRRAAESFASPSRNRTRSRRRP